MIMHNNFRIKCSKNIWTLFLMFHIICFYVRKLFHYLRLNYLLKIIVNFLLRCSHYLSKIIIFFSSSRRRLALGNFEASYCRPVLNNIYEEINLPRKHEKDWTEERKRKEICLSACISMHLTNRFCYFWFVSFYVNNCRKMQKFCS